MPVLTEDLKGVKKQPPAPAGALEGFLFSFVLTLGLLALFSWVGGVALNKGFGVHVPFIAGTLLLFTGVSVVKTVADQVAAAWHRHAVSAAVQTVVLTEHLRQESAQYVAELLKDA
jgi:hypothetical protein